MSEPIADPCCEVCGRTDTRLLVTPLLRWPQQATACETCLRLWREYGITDPAELRRRSLEDRP